MQKFIKKMKKGFTIMELVIVIAVIAILAAVLIPTFSNITENAKESAAMQEARNELTTYSVDHTEALTSDYVIESHGYYFLVDNGSFNATAADEGDITDINSGTEITVTVGDDSYTVTITTESSKATKLNVNADGETLYNENVAIYAASVAVSA